MNRNLVIVTLMLGVVSQVPAQQPTKKIYLIGNSLTWDTVPTRLDGDIKYHVDCGKSLPFIFENPQQPCVKSSTLWPAALKNHRFDLISLQTHYGATLVEDVDVISKWIEMQPDATVIIHTGWAHHAKRAAEYSNDSVNGTMQHSPFYVEALLKKLKKKYPQRVFRQTKAIDLLAQIAKDIEAGQAPIDSVEELHRDKIHMTHDGGRYLMHNAMRIALGQPISIQGFEKSDPKLREYLNGVLRKVTQTSR